MKIAIAAALVLLGFAWPFGAHALVMWRLSRVLIYHPEAWVAYTLFIELLPAPALMYAGFITYLRDYIPFPANALIAGAAAAVMTVALSVVFWLVIGQIGFTVNLPL